MKVLPVGGPMTVAVATCFTAVLLRATPQTPQTSGQRPVFRTGIDIVQLDVTVLGPDGRPVHGLTVDDFKLFLDGEPREILGFGEVNVPGPEEGPAWMRDVAPDVRTAVDGRVFVFLLDDAQTPFLMDLRTFIHPDEWIKTVKRITSEIIDRMGPTDVAAVICVYDQRCDQDFTSDHQRLKAAIARFVPKGAPYAARVSAGMAQSIAKFLRSGPSRRRTIIYVTPNLPTRPEGPPGSLTEQQMILTFEEAMRAGITVYGINLIGLRSWTTGSSIDADEFAADIEAPVRGPLFTAPPRSLALETGGFNVSRPEQFADGVRQILRETGSYYLLGYEPGQKKDTGYNNLSGFRQIEVVVNRPGLTVKTHRGYVMPKPTKPNSNPPPESTAALAGLLPKIDLPLSVMVAPFAVPGESDALLAIALGVGGPMAESRTRDFLDVQIRAFTPGGKQRAMTRKRVDTLVLPSRQGEALTDVVAELRLKPGPYLLRLAAYSERLGISGSVYTDVEVPDFANAPLSLSGVVLMSYPRPELATLDPLSPLLPAVPTTQRTFSPTAIVRAHVRAYQGGKKPPVPVTMRTVILDAKDTAVVDRTETIAAERFSAGRSTDVRVDVPMSQLTAGPHLLTIDATVGALTVQKNVRFTVR